MERKTLLLVICLELILIIAFTLSFTPFSLTSLFPSQAFRGFSPLSSGFSIFPEKTSDQKVILIGLDGAEWRVIKRLIRKDRLPHFEKLMEEGSYGYFYHVSPHALSPLTWTTIASGKTYKKHGIDGWNKGGGLVESNDVRAKRIWNILSEHGKKVGIFNWLVTWPPEKVNGFMVSYVLSKGSNWAYPNSLQRKIESNYSNLYEDSEVNSKVAFDLFKENKEKLDFYAAGFYDLDSLQHWLWKFIEPEEFNYTKTKKIKKYREKVYQSYMKYDRLIGKLMNQTSDNWTIIVFSDSGFKETPYLQYELSLQPLLKELGLCNFKEKIIRGRVIRQILPGTEVRQCPLDFPTTDTISKETYYKELCVKREGRKKIDKIINLLSEVRYAKDGKKFFKDLKYNSKTHRIEAVINLEFSNFYEEKVKKAYSLQPHSSWRAHMVDKSVLLKLPNNETFELWVGPEKSGDHPPHTPGIFLAEGPMIKENHTTNEMRVIDLMPTVLHLMGVPIPRNVDGKVVKGILKKGTLRKKPKFKSPSQKEVERKTGEINKSISKSIKRRLRDLGYIVK